MGMGNVTKNIDKSVVKPYSANDCDRDEAETEAFEGQLLPSC